MVTTKGIKDLWGLLRENLEGFSLLLLVVQAVALWHGYVPTLPDIQVARTMKVSQGDTYVFDICFLGYCQKERVSTGKNKYLPLA